MTKRDAEIFKDICDCVISGVFVFRNPESPDVYSLPPYYKLLKLRESGLVHLSPSSAHVMTWGDKKGATFRYHNNELLITRNSDTKEVLAIPGIYLTTVGAELHPIIECAPRMDYLRSLSKFLNAEDCRLFYLEDAVECSDGMLRWANRVIIEPNSEEIEESSE